MNKLVKYSAAALLAAGLFGMSTQTAHAATGYQRLTHNAYAYTYTGQRANKKLYRKGSRVRVIGSIELNGKKYNIISGNVYIKASNFKKAKANADLGDGYETLLIRNSYVYNSKGQRIKGMKLHKNRSITYYGQPVRINGKKYVLIGNNQYVRSCNVLLAYDGPTGSDSLNHTHRNTATGTTKRNSSSTSTSTGASSSSSANDSKQNSSSSSTANSSSSSSSSKSDTSKTDSNKQNQSKSDSKTPSKPTDSKDNSKNTGKDSSKTTTNTSLATDADYAALHDAIKESSDVPYLKYATWDKNNTFEDALRKANNYLTAYQYQKPTASSAEIQKATSDLKTALANLDGKAEFDKLPVVKVRVSETGNYTMLWDNDSQRQQALKAANEIMGAKDAQFVKLSDDLRIKLTNGYGNTDVVGTTDFVQPRFIYTSLIG